MSTETGAAPSVAGILPEYAGYLVVLAFGAVFAIITTGISHLEAKHVSTVAVTSGAACFIHSPFFFPFP